MGQELGAGRERRGRFAFRRVVGMNADAVRLRPAAEIQAERVEPRGVSATWVLGEGLQVSER
jgi:hypothetical protein